MALVTTRTLSHLATLFFFLVCNKKKKKKKRNFFVYVYACLVYTLFTKELYHMKSTLQAKSYIMDSVQLKLKGSKGGGGNGRKEK